MENIQWGITLLTEFIEFIGFRISWIFLLLLLFFVFLHLKLRFRVELKIRGLKARIFISMMLRKKEYTIYKGNLTKTRSMRSSKSWPLQVILKHIQIHKGEVFGVIGTGDPAHTAVLFGALMGVWPLLNLGICALTKGRFFALKIYPSMKSKVFQMNVVCIFCFKIWHIIAIFVHRLPKKGR